MYFDLYFSSWLESDFPINYILDISNYSILIFFLYIIAKTSTGLSNKAIIFFSFAMSTPFFFNGFIIDWYIFPDQTKYIGASREFRNSFFNFENTIRIFLESKLKVIASSYFYNLFPTTNFETFRSIGFINRFIYILMIIFLIQKNLIPLSIKIFLVMSPSLALYSSVSLRETVILVTMVFLFYNLIKKNYFFIFLLISYLWIIKFQNLIIVLLPLVLYILLYQTKNKIFSVVTFLSVFVLFLYFEQYIFDYINKYSYGFFSETYGNYKGLNTKENFLNYDLQNVIPRLTHGILRLTLSPFPNVNSLFTLIIFLENLFIFYLIYWNLFYNFYKKSKNEKIISIVWIITLLFSMAMYSIVSFNDGTIHRYKIIFITFILISFNIQLTNKKHSNK